MPSIANLYVELGLNSAKYYESVRSTMNYTDRQMARQRKKQIDAAKQTATAIGAAMAAGGAAFSYVVAQTANDIDALAKASDRLNVSTETLVGLQHAAELSGVAHNTLEKSVLNFQKALKQAGDGSATYTRLFDELNISHQDFLDMPVEEQLIHLAGALDGVENANRRTAIAVELFGARGATMLNMLSQSEEQLRATIAETDDLGLSLSRIDAASVEYMNDAITRAHAASKGWWRQITVALSPSIGAMADMLVAARKQAVGFGNSTALAGQTAGSGLGFVLDRAQDVLNGFRLMAIGAQELRKIFNHLTGDTQTFHAVNIKQMQTINRVNASTAQGARLSVLLQDTIKENNIKITNSYANAAKSAASSAAKINRSTRSIKIPEVPRIRRPKPPKVRRKIPEVPRIRRPKPPKVRRVARIKRKPIKRPKIRTPKRTRTPKAARKPIVRPVRYDSTSALESLDRMLATEEQKIKLANLKRKEELIKLNLSQADIKKAGFNNIVDLRRAYMRQSDAVEQIELKKIADRKKKENDNIINLHKEKYARIHLESLSGDIKLRAQEQARYAKEKEELELDIQKLRERNLLTAEIEQQHREAKEHAETAHQKNLKGIQEAAQQREFDKIQERVRASQGFFSALSGMAREGSKSQKRLFKISQAFALADATMSMYKGIGKAVASAPFPLNVPAIAFATASGAAQVANIKKQKVSGIAHGGLDNVPKEATYLLDKGERVLSPQQNRTVTKAAERINKGETGNASAQKITINNLGTAQEYEVQSITRDEVVLIAKDIVNRDAGRIVAGELSNPNSKVSRSLNNSTNAGRRRA